MKRRSGWTLLVLAVLLTVIPLVFVTPKGEDEPFAGADGQAEEMILELNPGYEPWFQSLWEPPGGEVESLLFALQAGLGAGFIGYYVGLVRGRSQVGQGPLVQRTHESG